MLSLEETSNVVVILQSDKQNLQHIQEQFHKTFKFESYPRLSLSLRCMLDGNYYSNSYAESPNSRGDGASNYQSEVLITYFLLHLMASAPPHKKEDDTLVHIPNTRSVLYEQLQKLETYIREKRSQASKDKDKKKDKESGDEDEIVRVKTVLKFFILQCVTGKMKGPALSQTPLEVLKADMKLLETEYDKLGKDQQILRDKLKELQSSYDDERKNSFGGFLGKGISPIVVVPDEGPESSEASPYGPTISNSDLNPLRFEPVFDRPRPPALPLGDNELTFLYTEGYFSDLMVDFSLSSTQSLEVRELILKAYKSRLTPEQQNQVLTLLKSDDAVLYRLGLSPTVERLQPLVENNPSVAEHCFARLLGTPYANDFLTALISLPLSLASMEIVNKLTVHPLPKDIIHTYISNIIASTRSTVDKGIQTRHARLVCVFIQSLIRTKILTENELFAETRIGVDTQEFCVEFVKVKESNQLYRLLRQMDPNSTSGDEQPSGSPLGNGTPIEPGPEK